MEFIAPNREGSLLGLLDGKRGSIISFFATSVRMISRDLNSLTGVYVPGLLCTCIFFSYLWKTFRIMKERLEQPSD